MSQITTSRAEFEAFYLAEMENYFSTGSSHFEAIKYALTSKGKRLRPLLCIGTCDLVNGQKKWSQIAAVAIEMIHTYSLIHDDLPAMDDDDFRRGVATCHKVFGEDVAILAGDGLLNEAYAYLTRRLQAEKCPDHLILKMMQTLAAKAGVFGMVWGQALDLHPGDISLDKILWIHELKTAKLFQASLLLGLFGNEHIFPEKELIDKFENFGKELGILFQLLDDLDDWNQHKGEELNVLKVVDLPTFFKLVDERFKVLWAELESLSEATARKTLLGEILQSLEEKYYQVREINCSL